jgi:protein-S-isoprenylcysteine O-methyltransferase Ste14
VTAGSESNVWSRGIVGIVLCLVGAVWVAQGTGAMHGSGMSGHGQYAVLGVVAIVVGLALLLWASRARRSRAQP